MTRAVLSIGSNQGDRLASLRSVVDGFGARVRAISPVYRTAPWGGVEQQDFLNAVVLVEDPAYTCRDWLRHGQRLEQAAGRERSVRWGARTLDVDIVWCAAEAGTGYRPYRSCDPELTLPHPYAHQRAFVLIPWLDVQPEATLEVEDTERAVSGLLAALAVAERDGVQRTDLVLDPTPGVAP